MVQILMPPNAGVKTLEAHEVPSYGLETGKTNPEAPTSSDLATTLSYLTTAAQSEPAPLE
jgi:hypothetical protein